MKKILLMIFTVVFLYADESFEDEEFLEEFEQEMTIEKKSDPLEGYNRVMTNFNDGVYEYVLYPVSKGYKTVVHKNIRQSVDNAFYNLLYPKRLLNNLLQGKFSNALEETGYFLVNSTVGLLGLFDIAKDHLQMKSYDEDFGQTLGVWGVGSGFHVVLPFFGPSNLRDMGGSIPDYYVNYLNYIEHRNHNLLQNSTEATLVSLYGKINKTSLNIEQYHMMKKDAVDLYPYFRDSYEQYREKQIKE